MKKSKYVFLTYTRHFYFFEPILYIHSIDIWPFFKSKNSYFLLTLRHSFHTSTLNSHQNIKGYKDPIRVFIDTFKSELEKSKKFQESVKALQDKSGKLGESEAYKKAKEAYKVAKESAGVASNFSNRTLKKISQIIEGGVVTVWESVPVRLARKGTVIAVDTISIATHPIRENKIYKSIAGSVKKVIHESNSSHYGGYVDKNTRRQTRKTQNETDLEYSKKTIVKENPNADVKIILYKESTWKEFYRKFRNNSKLFNRIYYWKHLYNHSENPIIRIIKGAITNIEAFSHRLFAENEAAKVVRLFKNIDSSFRVESFLQELREYILPEVIEAYVKGDMEILKLWLNESSYQIWFTTAKEYILQGLISDGKVLDIRGVDVVSYRILPPNNIPCLIISFRTQEIHLYRNAKSKKLIAGNEDFIQEVTYVAAFTKILDEISNSETKGWKIIDFVRYVSIFFIFIYLCYF
ncbi:protein translocase subunit TIM44 [Pneumocystis jirovecii RU7]|uniref:Mitochondrial import inner membrane translocase subunit TIM44 n=1 Tax=Pneumocystis jirovecii (strain RU7) TaxID=1408657 RepID=A0A0W4ZEQ0_PNEJ7|nr:protein translocase subunit TIM44 [Pneumocystis jirovecii RU7]KTW26861.1 hypothetical protein T551_03323 [Pneumocystis jirovecii RU7]